MPNQAQQTAESKPKVKKSVATPKVPTTAAPKAASKAAKPAKATAAAETAAIPKAPRKRTSKAPGATSVPDVVSHEAQILTEVSSEMISVRAYFLAENRQANGIHGDHSSDWHEAERQLRAEATAIAASLNHSH